MTRLTDLSQTPSLLTGGGVLPFLLLSRKKAKLVMCVL